ncbi:hypothetical protein RIF29_12662 [Crotalaria pallida]|uniref:BHLH domain-containing protein n=1 Tax=Crotalaria pallida TaxID=3830 RepID=A0AAN9IND3_CROPI
METLEAFPDGEWDCFPRMFATEENDHLPQFHGGNSLLFGLDDGNIDIQSMFCPTTTESGGNESHTNYYSGYPDNVLANKTYTSIGFSMMDEKNNGSFVPLINNDVGIEENVSFIDDERSDRSENFDHSQVEPANVKQPDMPELEVQVEDKINTNSTANPKKRPRASKDMPIGMKNIARSKKNQKVEKNGKEAEETNAGSDGHSCSNFTSEDDNANHENSGGVASPSKSSSALNSNGKTRASRGSATDPQSLYARKRRERINERLRILQNLVPNGTKVDISTMLEEAIRYVKFLQLQIKLLSSDDLWMYAPITYNGLDIGLDLNRKGIVV